MGHLNRCVYGILECMQLEEHRLKCNQEALTAMFDTFRAQSLEYIASDSCANFEATRYTVQGLFYSVFSRLREEGLLGEHAQAVLSEVDDYLHCVQLAVANEVVDAIPELQ